MIRISGLRKEFGGRTLLADVDLHVRPDDRLGLVGRNGTGKTTLLRILTGLEEYEAGRIVKRPGTAIGYLRQEIDPRSEVPILVEARSALEPLRRMEQQLRELEREIAHHGEAGRSVSAALADRYDALSSRFEREGGLQSEARLRATLSGLGIGPDRWDQPLCTQSGGWLMRVELAKLLLARPEVLLLDEPTNHLDLPAIRWFESVMAGYPGAVVAVSHDRTFLERHAHRIAELEEGRLTLYTGNYSAYLKQKGQIERQRAARNRNLDRKIRHASGFVERFGAKASKARQAQSRRKQIERLEQEREAPEQRVRGVRFRFPSAPRSGELVLRLEGIEKSYGDLCVYRGLDLEVRRGDRIALIGPNGAGKSTLLRLASGWVEADGGARELGHNVELAFYAQHQLEALNAGRTVLAEIEADAPLEQIPKLRNLLGTFMFSGDDVQKRVAVLSGGEKARLALARLLLRGANFLVLDEPTNHLDLQALEVLADALDEFRGTLLFISHDRAFINRIANQVLEIERGPEGAQVTRWSGNYDAYELRSQANEAPETAPDRQKERARKRERPGRREAAERRARERSLERLRECESELEEDIVSLERGLEELGLETADPAVARDADRMRAIQNQRREREARLRQLYREWEQTSAEIQGLEDLLETEPTGP
ncbi:MAG: ATP-binding cassette domain-containing protein [Myxococcales bacterium]|nr:ATP-binding cassette domain-containing protein [Myxococcales bacterium]